MTDNFSDKQTVSSLTDESYSTLEVGDTQDSHPITPFPLCELCSLRPSLGETEFLSCHTRPKFHAFLCEIHSGDATYFSISYQDSQSNCLICSRRLSDHESEQLRGCYLYYTFRQAKRPVREIYVPYVDQWPGQNSHSRTLHRNPRPYEPAAKDPNERHHRRKRDKHH